MGVPGPRGTHDTRSILYHTRNFSLVVRRIKIIEIAPPRQTTIFMTVSAAHKQQRCHADSCDRGAVQTLKNLFRRPRNINPFINNNETRLAEPVVDASLSTLRCQHIRQSDPVFELSTPPPAIQTLL
jgi:hypothetical protein